MNSAYVTVGGEKAVNSLTKEGFEGIVLEKPKPREEKTTKVIVAPYDLNLDVDLITEANPHTVIWAKRRMVQGHARPQAVVLIVGEIPEKIKVLGNEKKRIFPFWEEPVQCYKCYKFGHMLKNCECQERCHYCGRTHHSDVYKRIMDNKTMLGMGWKAWKTTQALSRKNRSPERKKHLR